VVITGVVLALNQCAVRKGHSDKDLLGFWGKTTPSPVPTVSPTPTPAPTPHAVAGTAPDTLGLISELNLNGGDIASYIRDVPFSFGEGGSYTALNGIITFRSDHWRQGATYGDATVTSKTLTKVWSADTASLPRTSGANAWTGNGWTGQPLIVKWPESTRNVMNLYDMAKGKDGLVEVIYPSLDGMVHFLDLETGERTRDKIDVGLPFKGAGSLDPRGYPLLYIGAGDAAPAHHGREALVQEYFIYSLIDGKLLYSFGKNPDPYAQRAWHAYDSAALVDAGADTLILPGENGILYTLKLNTRYDAAAGAISISPGDMLKMRYTTKRARDGMAGDTYWLGMEASPAMWGEYLYVSDNCGTMLCVNTTIMQVVWVQDTLDDSNSTPVLEVVNGKPYIYTSTSLHWTSASVGSGSGVIPIWKLDGLTGEVLWRRDYNCNTVPNVSGGVEGSGLLGKNSLNDLVFYTIARTPGQSDGKLVALRKNTGDEAWVYPMQNYSWSSPVAIYDKDSGAGYILVCDSGGYIHLLDGQTGALLASENLGGNVEASPAIYGNMLVVGTRQQKIWGIRID
jgi:hypothetical protein